MAFETIELRERFARYGTVLDAKPPPAAFDHLRPRPDKKDWFEIFYRVLMNDVQEGLAAAEYHLANVRDLERRVADIVARSAAHIPSGVTWAPEDSRRLDFEYQAFVLAGRRALDYSAIAFAAFFKSEGRSIRDVAKDVERRQPASAATALAKALDLSDLQEFLSNGEQRTVRDKIVHYESVPAGIVNVQGTGSTPVGAVAGGGEDLDHPWPRSPGSYHGLGGHLAAKLGRIQAVVFRGLEALGLPASRESPGAHGSGEPT